MTGWDTEDHNSEYQPGIFQEFKVNLKDCLKKDDWNSLAGNQNVVCSVESHEKSLKNVYSLNCMNPTVNRWEICGLASDHGSKIKTFSTSLIFNLRKCEHKSV